MYFEYAEDGRIIQYEAVGESGKSFLVEIMPVCKTDWEQERD